MYFLSLFSIILKYLLNFHINLLSYLWHKLRFNEFFIEKFTVFFDKFLNFDNFSKLNKNLQKHIRFGVSDEREISGSERRSRTEGLLIVSITLTGFASLQVIFYQVMRTCSGDCPVTQSQIFNLQTNQNWAIFQEASDWSAIWHPILSNNYEEVHP